MNFESKELENDLFMDDFETDFEDKMLIDFDDDEDDDDLEFLEDMDS